MRKLCVASALVLSFFLVTIAVPGILHAQHMGYGRYHGEYRGYGHGPQGGWNFCPYCGRGYHGRGGSGYGMGPGMMGPGYGHRMGPGMMGPGYGHRMGPGMMGPGYGQQYDYPHRPYERQLQEPLEKDDVQSMLENMLAYSRNPNLKVGRIEDKGVFYEAEITTKEGSLVDKLLVDKSTGRMRSIY